MSDQHDQIRAKIDEMAKDFLDNVSWQLAEGSKWLHAHHDGLFDKALADLTVGDLVGLMQAVCESDAYDSERYLVCTTIPLSESEQIRIDFPLNLEAALGENQGLNNEPPSLNIFHRAAVIASVAGSFGFRAIFEAECVPASLRNCGVRIWYGCSPYDKSDLTEWSRSIYMMHLPEWNWED